MYRHMGDYNIFSINGTMIRYSGHVPVSMKLNAPTLRNIAAVGFLLSVIGGWMLFSETSPLLGVAILITGAFLFLLGRRGAVLLLEKDITSNSKKDE